MYTTLKDSTLLQLGEINSSSLGPCACVGPDGDCPCIRKMHGLPVEITESHISPSIFALLSDEDKNTINALKKKAFNIYLFDKQKNANLTQPANQEYEHAVNQLAKAAAMADAEEPHVELTYTPIGSNPLSSAIQLDITSNFFYTLDLVLTAVTDIFGSPCMVAGGAVRDTLLGVKVKDIDVFIEYSVDNMSVSKVEKFATLMGATSSKLSEYDYDYGKDGIVSIGDVEGSVITGKPIQLIFVSCVETYNNSFCINLSKVSYSLPKGLMLTREFIKDYSHNQITISNNSNIKTLKQKSYAQRIQAKYPGFKMVQTTDN